MAFFTRSNLHFGMFRFDSRKLQLHRNGEQVALRPKSAALLGRLLAATETVVTKREILADVWGRDGVSDQTLFQTVSDLRRALQPLEPIVTHPNRGYCFALPVRRFSRVRRMAAAAACALTIGVMAWWAMPDPGRADSVNREAASLSPALRAFATGVEHLRRDQADAAERYFRLAVRENPGFAEARLMIGEALLAQGRVADARAHTDRFLAARSDVHDYAGVSAMSLISRTEDAAGQPASALHWALAAARQAHDQGYVCAAVGIEDQIERLLAQQANDVPGPIDDPADTVELASTPVFALRHSSAATHCVDLGAGPDARWVPPVCAPTRTAARRRTTQTILISMV